MTLLYKVLYRKSGDVGFYETPDWLSCDECIRRMRSLLAEDPSREFQIVDDHRVVVVSTLANARHGTSVGGGRPGRGAIPNGNAGSMPTPLEATGAMREKTTYRRRSGEM